tara:strand:- start:1017 stop:1631 length:615 start_codon:yes stop_codon:yes gene_type:complete
MLLLRWKHPLVLATIVSCANSAPPPEEEVPAPVPEDEQEVPAEDAEATQHIYYAEDTSQDLYIITNAPPQADISKLGLEVDMEEKSDFWWVRIDVPENKTSAIDSADGLRIDLTEDTGVVFTQNYEGVCDPSADVLTICWLRERYTAADEGLSGSIFMKSDNEGMTRIAYFVDWSGITDRFTGPPSWHQHTNEGGAFTEMETLP